MEFSSLDFLIRFLPVFLIIYYAVPARLRNPVLFLGSILFYSMGSWQDAILLAESMTINFIAVLIMDRQRQIRRRVILILLLIYNVGMLCFFKYTDWALPLGISFYTFTMLSYVLDVYWKKKEALTSYLDFGTYVWMFPKLIMGPIAAFRDTAEQLRERRIDGKCIEHGVSLFVVGLGYKVIIANHLAILWRDIQGIGFESISTPLAWIGAAGYSAQLFFDFQGYSLMALGIGEMLGFSLPENFNHPYRSRTVGEYYRRWHISLGQWFRNYLYIPLGGNRKGAARTFLNLLVVWVVTGMWHGASVNFPLWGLLLFVFIALEKFCIGDFLERHGILSRLYIWFVIPLTWVVFAISDLKGLGVYFSRLFPFFSEGVSVNTSDWMKYGRTYVLFFVLAFLVSLPIVDRLWKRYWNKAWMKVILLAVFWFCVYEIANGLNNPFLYFSF